MKILRLKKIIFLILIAQLFLTVSCSFIKMGSLFLSGDITQKHFSKSTGFEYKGGLIFVKVKLNNLSRDYRFLIDTGAAFNVISENVARDLGIKVVAKDKIKDASKKTAKVDFCKISRISIAGIPFMNTAAAIMNVDKTPRLKCYRIEGVIGANLLRLVNHWKIDYKNRIITFSDYRELSSTESPGLIFPFDKNIQRIPELDLKLYGNLKLKCRVDLGSTGGFVSYLSTWKEIKKFVPNNNVVSGKGELGGGALGGNQGSIYIAKLDDVRVSETKLDSVFMTMTPNNFTCLGNGFFQDYTITFNWEKEQMTLHPYEQKKRPAEKHSFGFGTTYNEKTRQLIVDFLYINSSAYEQGVKIGDRIIRINNKLLKSVSEEEYCRYLFEPETLMGKGKELTMTVERNGKQFDFKLEKQNLFGSEK